MDKLEPIIQSEVSQKAKNKYHIQQCIDMECRKMVLKKLSAGQQWGHRHKEQTYGHGAGGGDGGMYGESNMETYITIWKTDSYWEFAVWLSEVKLGLCNNLERWDGEEGRREVEERGNTCIPMAGSCWCLPETNTIL